MGIEANGASLIEAATDLVHEVLEAIPEGLTNQEVGDQTGLRVELSKQRGWISWTILHRLMEAGEVTKDGRRYRLNGP